MRGEVAEEFDFQRVHESKTDVNNYWLYILMPT